MVKYGMVAKSCRGSCESRVLGLAGDMLTKALECVAQSTGGDASRVAFRICFLTSGRIAVRPARTSSEKSEEDSMTNANPTLRQPSAFLPVAMSLIAFALVLSQIALVGVARQADEGTAAHLWQILIAAQVPIIAFFAIKYLPQKPKPAVLILALQVSAVLAACAPVFFLHW